MSKKIQNDFKVSVQYVVFDFARLASAESVSDLESKLDKVLKDKEISILVSNVSMCKMDTMATATVEKTMIMINVNVNS